VAICTAFRHDSVEDGLEMEEFKRQLLGMHRQIEQEDPSCDSSEMIMNIEKILINVDIMTQKKLLNEDGSFQRDENGKIKKQDVRIYIEGTLDNPIVFLLKQKDTGHNFGTMLGAEKFPAERRAQRLNERDRIYGDNYGLKRKATKKWPNFENAIHTMDANLREIISKNFRYLESVDCFYENAPPAFRREGLPMSATEEHVDCALQLDLPKPLHILHIYLDRMIHSVKVSDDPAAYQRLQDHIEYTIKPSLAHRSECFPSLFPPKSPPEITPYPIAF
jgi:hypothetical protein